MIPVAVSQRVARVKETGERRDALDQRWIAFCRRSDLLPVLIPNDPAVAKQILRLIPCRAVLLTGGNDLVRYGGDAPERDRTERFLLKHALRNGLPLLGVCRGMQLIQDFYGVPLRRFEGHVKKKMTIRIDGKKETVNSYHHFGSDRTKAPLAAWAAAPDGVVKAVRHRQARVTGIMWHPERFRPFRARDIRRVKELFHV